MFTPLVRLLFIVLNLVVAFFLYQNREFPAMALLLLSAGLFAYGYFKNGTVYLAFRQLKKERYDKAEDLLSKISNPERLGKGQKSYFHFSKGFIALHKKDLNTSAQQFKKALAIGLRTDNDTAIVLINLAGIAYEEKDFQGAQEYVDKVRGLTLKPALELEVDAFQKKLDEFVSEN